MAIAISTDRDRAPHLTANRLLAVLPPAEYAALAALRDHPLEHGRAVAWGRRADCSRALPAGRATKVTTLMRDGRMIAVGAIGREGSTGLPAPPEGTPGSRRSTHAYADLRALSLAMESGSPLLATRFRQNWARFTLEHAAHRQ